MNDRKLIPLTDPSQVPADMTETEAQEFWQTHEMTEGYLAKAQLPEDDNLPVRERKPVASRLISLKVEDDMLERLKSAADRKSIGYQTLLKQFVLERLYEEEKRDGVL